MPNVGPRQFARAKERNRNEARRARKELAHEKVTVKLPRKGTQKPEGAGPS